MNTSHLSEQEQIRREKLGDLLGMGIDPYPAELFPVNNSAVNIKQQFNEAEALRKTNPNVSRDFRTSYESKTVTDFNRDMTSSTSTNSNDMLCIRPEQWIQAVLLTSR